MLSVTFFIVVLGLVMLNAAMLSVMVPLNSFRVASLFILLEGEQV